MKISSILYESFGSDFTFNPPFDELPAPIQKALNSINSQNAFVRNSSAQTIDITYDPTSGRVSVGGGGVYLEAHTSALLNTGIKFGTIDGDFQSISDATDNDYLPRHISGDWYICPFEESDDENDRVEYKLKNFVNGPTRVDGNVFCDGAGIVTFDGLPSIGGYLELSHNTRLTTLEGVPTDLIRTTSLNLINSQVKSLAPFAPLRFDSLVLTRMKNLDITLGLPDCTTCIIDIGPGVSFKGIHKTALRSWNCDNWVIRNRQFNTTLPTNLLGILLLRGVKSITIGHSTSQQAQFRSVSDILNKHLKGDRDINECQEELIDAGFKEQAKL